MFSINGRKAWSAVCAVLLLAFPQVYAQEASPGPSPSGSVLNRVVVTAANIPIDESIIPTTQPSGAVFGLDINVKDVPRNVTIISRAQLDDISIRDVRDFTKLTTSAYTTSNFGAPANPSIRGQTADVFVNGMREGLTSNGNGMPVDFNYVESVDILKGPPTVVYGVSNYDGGFVDYNTKKPFFDKLQGSASATIGDYDQYRWNVDLGGPIIADKLAFRISYSGEESGSYYENGLTNSHSIYLALTWTPSDRYTITLNADALFAKYTENFGINRPTQDLIDNGRYITGFAGAANITGAGSTFFPTGTTTLDRQIRLLRPGDDSYGRKIWAQAIQTLTLSDSATLVNNTFFEYINRHTESSYAYAEIIDPAFTIENRTELRLNFETSFGGGTSQTPGNSKDGKTAAPILTKEAPFVLASKINLGLDINYREVTAYDDYFNEPANSWDLSLSRNLINFVNFSGVAPVPGRPGILASPGSFNGDTNRSRILDIAPFYQHALDIGEHFSILAGARADILWVHVQDPLFDEFGLTGRSGDNTVVADPNFNISPTFKPFKWLTTYFTYNYSQSIAVGNGGGFPVSGNVDSAGNFTNNISSAAQLHQVSQLFELGAKASLLGDTLFLSTAVFYQQRNEPQQGGASLKNNVKGFEIEAKYQPSESFYLSVGYSYLDSYVYGSPFESQVYPVNFPQQHTADGFIIADNGASLPYGHYRQPGLPKHLVSLLAHYQIPTQIGTFGAIFGTNVTSSQFLGYNGYVQIPAQYTMDLTLFYKTKDDHVEARVALLNLTNQKNFSPPNPTYGYASVVEDLPFRVEGTITLRF